MTVREIAQLANVIRVARSSRSRKWGYEGVIWRVQVEPTDSGWVVDFVSPTHPKSGGCVNLFFKTGFTECVIEGLLYANNQECPGWRRGERGYASRLMRMVILLCKRLKVRDITLVDKATKRFSPGFTVEFSRYLALAHNTSFYGKYGFVYRDPMNYDDFQSAVVATETWLDQMARFTLEPARKLIVPEGKASGRNVPRLVGGVSIPVDYPARRILRGIIQLNPDMTIRDLVIHIASTVSKFQPYKYEQDLVKLYTFIDRHAPQPPCIDMIFRF